MNRQEIVDHVRLLADELTEAPEGLFTDTELESVINISLPKIHLELIEFLPWYFRKPANISLVSGQREYNIRTDLGIDGNIIITTANQKLNFDEGNGPYTATIDPASYTPTTLCANIKTKMDGAGGAATYTVTYSGKVFRISNDGATLNLLCNTGADVANGIWATIGFATAADKGSFTSYAGDYYIDVQNFLMFESIMNREVGGKSKPLIYLKPQDLFLHETVGQTIAPASVKYWGYHDLDEIFILPIANGNAADQLLAYFFRKIASLDNDTDVPEMPSSTHELVCLDVLRTWFLRDGDKSGATIDTRYNALIQNVNFRLGNPQGPRPGKRPGVAEIARTT